MKARALVLMTALWSALAVGGELGARFEVGNGATGAGWFQLSGQVGFATLSGRAEVDLLHARLRRLAGAASARWEEVTASLEASVLSTGRLDLSTTVSWKGMWRTGLGLLSSQAGGKVTWVDLLGGRFVTAAGWGFGRFDREPFWAELNLNTAWPGSSLQVEGRVGLAGPAWLTLVVSGTGIGLELGAEQGWLSTYSYLSLSPAFQTITVGVAGEGVRAQARLTVRAPGSWSASLNLTATQGSWRGSVTTSFLKAGLEKTTVEVRYTLGD
ncbi:MAG: hypothetical protein ABID40_05725 [Candidatus Bipolaricaulota bacterium]